jgi:acyl-CoA thioesterase I
LPGGWFKHREAIAGLTIAMLGISRRRQHSRFNSRRITVTSLRRLAALVPVALFLSCCPSHSLPLADDRPVKIVVIGDSIAAGFGLLWNPALPERLEQVLRQNGYAVTVVNEGVSGDTVSDGLRRLDKAVPEDTDALIIELGPNDAERGIDPDVTRAGLAAILQRMKERRIQVLLTGMRGFASSGEAYVGAFAAIYPWLAAHYSFVWYPFILDGVAGNPTLYQVDGEHPNAAGVNVIVQHMLPQVEELIARVQAARRREAEPLTSRLR